MILTRTGVLFLLCFCFVSEIRGGLLDILKEGLDVFKDPGNQTGSSNVPNGNSDKKKGQENHGGLLDIFKGGSDQKKDSTTIPIVKEFPFGRLERFLFGSITDGHPTKKTDNNKKKGPNLLQSANDFFSSVATGDRIKTMIVLINVELGDKSLHPIFKFALRGVKKVLEWIHPLYLKLFPDKVDRGSVTGNVQAGADGLVDTMVKAGKMAQSLGKMFIANYLS